jgi:hypothetical protein
MDAQFYSYAGNVGDGFDLTPRGRVSLENLIVKKFPSFHRTRKFITVFTIAHH